jgi:plasmid stability protein
MYALMMRTTLTLDDDVAADLARLAATRERSFKALVNDLLRAGLRQLDQPSRHRPTFHTHVVDLGASRLPNVDDIAEVIGLAEGDGFR